MPTKTQPLGICDLCLGKIPASLGDYTTKGTPRLHCSRQCMSTANSRAGAPIRSKKAKARVASGQWTNPAELNPPDPANVAAGVSRARKREVEEGRWRNPALSGEARAKLSRPRKHSGPLHRAIEKLKQGLTMADLTDEEAEAYRANARKRRAARRDEANAYHRRRYREQRAAQSDAERAAQNERWRRNLQRRQVAKRGQAEVITTERTPDPETGEMSFTVRLVRRWTRREDGEYADEIIGYCHRLRRDWFGISRSVAGPWQEGWPTLQEAVAMLAEEGKDA